MNKIILFITFTLMSFSAAAVPMSFLTKEYYANPQDKGTWIIKQDFDDKKKCNDKSECDDFPIFTYQVCHEKSISAQQSIVVMCGVNDDNGVSSAENNIVIWYLNGDKPEASGYFDTTVESTGSRAIWVDTALLGKNTWAATYDADEETRIYLQTFRSYYIKFDDKVVKVANLPILSRYNDCTAREDEKAECLKDDLKNKIRFIADDKNFFTMKITSEGKRNGKLVKKEYIVPFDSKRRVYPIPDELQISY
ncbi:conserved exported hypothetical protein [Enterobacterales bacterium 8AC]|nr:conserved exported hypothetical protein [Enterobacterales bacterium 8AC]